MSEEIKKEENKEEVNKEEVNKEEVNKKEEQIISETSNQAKNSKMAIIGVVAGIAAIGIIIAIVVANKPKAETTVNTISENDIISESENTIADAAENEDNTVEPAEAFGEKILIDVDSNVISAEENEYEVIFVDSDNKEVEVEGISISNPVTNYELGEITITEGDFVTTNLDYIVTLKMDLSYDPGMEYPADMTWKGNFKEWKFFDYYTGEVINNYEAVPGEEQENKITVEWDSNTYEVAIKTLYEEDSLAYSEWELGEDEIYHCEAINSYTFHVEITAPADYDGIVISPDIENEDSFCLYLSTVVE